jgi:hypothetical protein
MNRRTCRSMLLIALVQAAVALLSAGPRAWAQCPPGVSLTITGPANGASTLGGTIRIDITRTPAPAGWSWYDPPHVY